MGIFRTYTQNIKKMRSPKKDWKRRNKKNWKRKSSVMTKTRVRKNWQDQGRLSQIFHLSQTLRKVKWIWFNTKRKKITRHNPMIEGLMSLLLALNRKDITRRISIRLRDLGIMILWPLTNKSIIISINRSDGRKKQTRI